MTTTTKDAPPTLTPEQAWERRVERAKEWAREKLSDDHDAGERLHLKVLLTHLDTLALLLERRTEERDGLLEAGRGGPAGYRDAEHRHPPLRPRPFRGNRRTAPRRHREGGGGVMGEIADWMIAGGGCEWCGVYIGEEVGYPRLCDGCAKDAREMGYEVNERGQIVSEPEEEPA